MTFGEKLLALRQRAGMSQDALAERLGVSRQAVSKWERDEAVPETDKVIRIAQLFSVSTDYLLLNEREQPWQTYQQPTYQPVQSRDNRLERFVRRHGYKSGYFLIGVGAFLCVIALLIFILIPRFGKGFFDTQTDFGGSWGSGYSGGVIVEGDELDEELMNEIMGAIGEANDPMDSWWGGGFEDEYNQQVQKMQQGWNSATGIMAALVGVPILLLGIAGIALGALIVVKGKKLAAQTE